MLINSYVFAKPWTPALISTALWLDASDASSITSVSGRISQWSDKSGNNRHATQSTSAQQPKVTANAQNGLNAVEFDPASNTWQRLIFSRLTNLGHVFFVAKKNDLNRSQVVISDATANDLRGTSLGAEAGSNFFVQQLAPTVTTATRGFWHIAEIATDGTNATLGIDAGRVTQADTDLMSCSSMGYYSNPNVAVAADYSFRGQIGELIISASVLTDANRQRVEGYLAWKWGLQANLPAGHPYKSSAPTA